MRLAIRLAIVAGILAGALMSAQAQLLGAQAIQNFAGYTPWGNGEDATLGWRFRVTHWIQVTHLGLWDFQANGLSSAHDIAIWTDSGSLVASATIPSGTATSTTPAPGGVWRWIALSSPVNLAPGTYRIGAWYGAFTDALAANFSGTMTITTGPFVVYNDAAYIASAGITFPNLEPSNVNGYFGPNFLYVPEPALLQLPFLLGLGGVGAWLRWRKLAS